MMANNSKAVVGESAQHWLAVLSVTMIILLALAGSMASAQAPDRAAILEKYSSSVVRITVEGRTPEDRPNRRIGTGVIVSPDGDILTAKHVVGDDAEWAETAPGSRLPARTVTVTRLDEHGVQYPLGTAGVWIIPGYDLALLTVNAINLPSVQLSRRLPNPNTSVVALLWEPGSGVPEAVTSDLVPTDRARYGRLLTARISVAEGHSGSGLFDSQLQLVGIVVNKIDGQRALAVPATSARSVLLESEEVLAFRGKQTSPANAKRLEPLPHQSPPMPIPPQSLYKPSSALVLIDRDDAEWGVNVGWELGQLEIACNRGFAATSEDARKSSFLIKQMLRQSGVGHLYRFNPFTAKFERLLQGILDYYIVNSPKKHAAILLGLAAARAKQINTSAPKDNNAILESHIHNTIDAIDDSIVHDKEALYRALQRARVQDPQQAFDFAVKQNLVKS